MTDASEPRPLHRSDRLTATADVRDDLASGLVDPALLAILDRALASFRLDVRMIRTGHPMGPVTPAGRRNGHAWGCAADVYAVDGAEVVARPVPAPVVRFGGWLRDLEDPALVSVMGPAQWHAAVRASGPPFRDDPVANSRHTDHVHVGVAIPEGAAVPES